MSRNPEAFLGAPPEARVNGNAISIREHYEIIGLSDRQMVTRFFLKDRKAARNLRRVAYEEMDFWDGTDFAKRRKKGGGG